MSNRARAKRLRTAWLCIPLFVSCAKPAEEETVRRDRLTAGGEVFRVFCKRAAKAAFPNDLEGTSFNAPCSGTGPALQSEPHFDALIARRDKIVGALDRVLGENGELAAGLIDFEDDEIHNFLGSLVPLYDPPSELMPESTRAISKVLARVLDENDPTGRQALDVLSRTTGRVGYRPIRLALGMVRPLLQYEGLDDFITSSIDLVAKGGKAEKEYDDVIHGLSLELATYDPTPPEPDSTLTLTRDLLLSKLEHLDEVKDEKLLMVRRDRRGVAVPNRVNGALPAPFMDGNGDNLADIDGFGRLRSTVDEVPAPYAVRGEKGVDRDEQGRALNVWDGSGEQPLFEDLDLQPSMLAGMAREQTKLLTASTTDRSTVEKLGRGLPGLLGKTIDHQQLYGKAMVSYQGPDFSKAPVVDLLHAFSQVVGKPEFLKVLEVLEATLRDHEPTSAKLMKTLLAIDARADMHPEAQLVGENGVPGGPHRFWDEMIDIGVRMTERPGLIEAIMRSIMDERAAGQGALLANWMRYRDVVPYKNAPSTLPEDINGEITHTWTELVDRTQPGRGTNRSVFQKTMAMVNGLNGQRQCNKMDAKLKVQLGPVPITLPLRLPGDNSGYKPCELFEVQDMVEIHILSVLDRASIPLKPGDLNLLGGLCPIVDVTCLGKTQEASSQIVGFDDTPTPKALARFVFSPPNEFLRNITDPVTVKDGPEITTWEPYALFPMEIVDPEAKPFGQPDHPGLTFLDAGYTLMKAFDDHELRDSEKRLLDGYLFGEMLSTFHRHWGERTSEPCNGPPQETCTQSLDPAGKFFSYQTDIRSYEPLLAEALGDEKLLEVLHEATKSLAQVRVGNEDGITIMARFVELMLKPDENLRYRDGRNVAYNNLGEEVGAPSPLYMVLDALKAIDKSFETDEHKERLAVWREARSELIDTFMTIEEGPDGQLRMQDRIGKATTLHVLPFLRSRIQAHIDAGDVDSWAAGLPDRAVKQLDRPVVGAVLRLLDRTWEEPEAGKEFMKLTKYLFAEEGQGFAVSMLAGGDLLQLMDDAVSIAPLLDLAAEAVAPGVTDSVDVSGKEFVIETGIARKMVELQAAISHIDTRRPSTTAKLLRNLVSDSMGDGSTPLEVLLDAIAEVERVDPTKPSDAPLDREDIKRVIQSVHGFVSDNDRGLERLYQVIQHRTRGEGE